jgi:hypothetical protein
MRRGVTLAELIVGVALAGAAGGFMVGVLVRQQRFYSSAAGILDLRAQLRDGADVLATDIRSAAVSGFGFPVMTDTALEMYSAVASSVVCAIQSSQAITLPPISLVSGSTLTSMLVQPDTGDLAAVFVTPAGRPDSGRWETLRIASFSARPLATSCPASTGFTAAADAWTGATGYAVAFVSAPTIPFRPGAPLQFLRRARYSLYRSSDGKWYLGYRRCAAMGASSCAAVQPVSGPYEPHAGNPSSSGLSFRYLDRNGAVVQPASSSNVARVEIVLRGRSARAASLSGDARTAYRDSAVIVVSPRNR